MAGEIGEFFGEHLKDRRIDLNATYLLGAENQTGQDVAAAANANDGDVGGRLYEVGGVDDIIFQIAEFADVAIVVPGDDRTCIGIDIDVMLVNPDLGRAGKSPADRVFPDPLPHPYP